MGDAHAPRAKALSTPIVAAEAFVAAPPLRVVDLRARIEYAADHWPGAVNVPLFDDAQRALVGTLYRKVSPQAAFEAGRRALETHLEPFVQALSAQIGVRAPQAELDRALAELAGDGLEGLQSALAPVPIEIGEARLVLYCQRGGLRSRATVALLTRLGLGPVALVDGGYKAWRRLLCARIAAWRAPRTLVLRGLTGVGKTLVLRELEALRPGSTLDLEALAQHRSSVLGMVGLAPVGQKQFETRLALRLERLRGNALAIEGESRKVGDVIVPPSVWSAIQGGVNVELHAPLARRVEVLCADYLGRPSSREQLAPQLDFLEARLRRGGWSGSLVELLHSGREAQLVEVLLERYYDPLYRHSEQGRRVAERIDASSPARAAQRLAELLAAQDAGADAALC